jgi:hypothetical protein
MVTTGADVDHLVGEHLEPDRQDSEVDVHR